MMTDVGFLFSVTAVNMSLSSLAGLVIAFRRTGTWAAHDIFRLRQIVEWGFANVLIALAAFPIARLLGSEESALRVLGAVTPVYIIANLLLLKARLDRAPELGMVVYVRPIILALDLALPVTAVATAVLATMPMWELVLLLLTARPMLAFGFVLATLGREGAT